MIPNSTIAILVGMILIGIILPTCATVLWLRKTKQPFTTVLIGAAIFFVFAIVLESLPKLVLFQTNNSIGAYVMSNTFLYMSIAALLAGLFEETGRLVAFKFLLKKETKRETAITYGIGHGGFEALYILAMTGIQYIAFAVMINGGQFDSLVAQVQAAAPEQVSAIAAIPETLAALSASSLFASGIERVSAMMIHVACSIIVFKAVRVKGKLWMYGLAVLLHASIDMIAALYQCGYITNIFLLESVLLIWAAALLAITVRAVYKKLDC